MIVYHQAFDLYHTVYRMMRLLIYFKRGENIEVERLRIWDFYVLFPNKLHEMRVSNDVKKIIRNVVKEKSNRYEKIPNNRIMFEKIKPYQITAIKSLASYGIISIDYLANNRIQLVSKEKLVKHLPDFIQADRENNVIKFLTAEFFSYPLYGKDGLKDRTQLMESRYDA